MILKIYAVRDVKSGYGSLLLEQNDAVAMRNFYNAFVDPKSVLHNNRKDFDLLRIGEFDNETGQIIVQEVKDVVAEGINYGVGDLNEV